MSALRRRCAIFHRGGEQIRIDFVNRTADGLDGRPEVEQALSGETVFEPLDFVGKSFAHFISCIENSTTPLVDGEAGLRALKTAVLLEEQVVYE